MGYLKDNTAAASAVNNYSYTVTSTASSSLGAVTEGSSIEFKITRTKNSGDDLATTIYVGTEGSSAIDGVDYKGSSEPLEVVFKKDETEKTITVETYEDDETEAQPESFYLGVFKTKAKVIEYLQTGDSAFVDSYSTGYIKDPAAASGTYSYSVTTNSTQGSAKSEGSDITATITRSPHLDLGESTIYLNTTAGSADDSDYVAQKATPVTFSASDTSKAVTIKTSTDGNASEGQEYFFVDLFKTTLRRGWTYFEYATSYINDAAAFASG